MWILYGSRGSGSAAVEAALERCNLPYRVVHASSWEDASAQEELRRANPLAQIPTLQHPDGSVLSESAAILIHLGLSYPEAALLPGDPRERAQALRGLVYIAANCYAAIGIIDYPERWCVDGDAALHERIRSGARARLHRYWEIFADSFPAAALATTPTPGALGILASVVSRWSGARAHLRQTRPAMLGAIEQVQQHASLAPVFARHWPE